MPDPGGDRTRDPAREPARDPAPERTRPEDRRAPVETNRLPAALAAVAAEAVNAGAPGVRLDVRHATGSPGDDRPAGWGRADPVHAEHLRFAVPGAVFGLRTWSIDRVEEVPRGVVVGPPTGLLGDDAPRDLLGDQGLGAGAGYAGSATQNPAFLYDWRRTAEVLVTLDPGPWAPTYVDTLLLGSVLERLASAAAEHADGPILFLQTPVAPFKDASPHHRADGSGEEPRPARALAVRMAIGLDESTSRQRLDFVTTLATYAEEHGLGLQTTDRRAGRVRGEWWSVLPPSRRGYQRSREALLADLQREAAAGGVRLDPDLDTSGPADAYLVTMTGPARVGSSLAVLRELAARRVGVLAAAVTALQEVAFINLLLPVAPARQGRPFGARTTSLERGLGDLASQCGIVPQRATRGRTRSAPTSARDYRCLATGPVPFLGSGTGPARSVWVSWDLDAAVVEWRDPVDLIVAYLRKHGGEVRGVDVDYVRSRRLTSGRILGRAKLGVELAEGLADAAAADALSELCELGEADVVKALLGEHEDRGLLEVRVAWRERRLGRAPLVL